MKINRKLIAALAMVSVAFTACQEPELNTGLDATLAGPSAVAYDGNGSGDTVIAVYWDAKEAVAAGATSFTLQLLNKADENPDPYSVNKTVLVTSNYEGSPSVVEGDAACDQYQFSGLTKGKSHWVRIRANYPNSVFTEWAYLLDKTGTAPARIKVGEGEYDPTAPLTANVTAGLGWAWILIDKQVDCTYEVYNGTTKLESEVTKSTDTEDYICATGLEVGKAFNLTLKVVDGADVREVPNLTGTCGTIAQLKENVGPTHVAVGWTEVPVVSGNLKRAYSGQLATDPEMKNLVYDIDFRDAMTDMCGAFNSSSWYGKSDGTNLNIPTAAAFGQLKANTKYYFRIKTTEKNSDGVDLANPMGNSLWSPVIELTTEDVHKPVANEVLFQGFDDVTLQSDMVNYAAGTTPNPEGGTKTDYVNPWPYSDAKHWNLYNSTNSHKFGTWGMADKGKFLDGQDKHLTWTNLVFNEKCGSAKGYMIGDECSPHMGFVKVGTGSSKDRYIVTAPIESPLLSAAGTPCTLTFKACPVVTDTGDMIVKKFTAGVGEEIGKVNLPRACSEYTDANNYVYDGKWVTYTVEVVLKPGDSVGFFTTDKLRFVLDDIHIVAK